jgi:hypothetical protein
MTRKVFGAASVTVVLSALMLPSSRADEYSDAFAPQLQVPPAAAPAPFYDDSIVAQPLSSSQPLTTRRAVLMQTQADATEAPQSIDPSIYMSAPQAPQQQPGYVRLGAPLYPSPRPNIPIWTGATMITTPALAPHEMLYPHTYRAIYPPFYHRVKGGWFWTPFGMRSHERWELQGTQVEVKYRSQPPLWVRMSWHPPVQSRGHGNRY